MRTITMILGLLGWSMVAGCGKSNQPEPAPEGEELVAVQKKAQDKANEEERIFQKHQENYGLWRVQTMNQEKVNTQERALQKANAERAKREQETEEIKNKESKEPIAP